VTPLSDPRAIFDRALEKVKLDMKREREAATEVIRTDERAGWKLAVVAGAADDSGFFVKDSDLAVKYGALKPHIVNDPADTAIALGKIVKIGLVITAGDAGGNPGRYFEREETYTNGKGGKQKRTVRYYDFRAALCIAHAMKTQKAVEASIQINDGFARIVEQKHAAPLVERGEVALLVQEIRADRAAMVQEMRADRALIVARLDKLEQIIPAPVVATAPPPGTHAVEGSVVHINRPSAEGRLSMNALAREAGFPASDNEMGKSVHLMKLILVSNELHKNPAHAKALPLPIPTTAERAPMMREQWHYDRAVLGLVTGDVKAANAAIHEARAADKSWDLAFAAARRAVKRAHGEAA
jgi:hypothetical protein